MGYERLSRVGKIFKDKSISIKFGYYFEYVEGRLKECVRLDIPQTRKEQELVWELLDNKKECKRYISGIIDEVSKGKVK